MFDKHPAIEVMNAEERERRKEKLEAERKAEEKALQKAKKREEKRLQEIEEEQRRKSEEEELLRKRLELEETEKKLKEQEEDQKKRQLEVTKGHQRDEDLEEAKRLYAIERQKEWEEHQRKLQEYEEYVKKKKQESEERMREFARKLDEKKKEIEEGEELLANKEELPVILWFKPSMLIEEVEKYLVKHGLSLVVKETQEDILKELKANRKVIFLVTEFYVREEGTTVAAGLNMANIIREEMKILIPIICYSERVRKEPKLQEMCRDAGIKPVMRGQSLYKLLGIPEPPLVVK